MIEYYDDPAAEIIQRLRAANLRAHNVGVGKWECQCPAHEDQKASFHVARSDSGNALIHCKCGCTAKEIAEKLGLTLGQLFKRDGRFHEGNGYPKAEIDWQAEAERFAANLTPERRAALAAHLGVPEAAVVAIDLIGWKQDNLDPAGAWCFPERDGQGRIIGIMRRYPDGTKKTMAGGRRGLTIPKGIERSAGAIYCPEGHSDVLALAAMGLPAIGRPQAQGNADMLADFLGRLTPRPTVVLGEMDPKPDGTWPGRDGAAKTAAELQSRLGSDWQVSWALPPDGAKDARKWAVARQMELADEWSIAGEEFGKIKTMKPDATADASAANDPPPEPKGFRWQPIDSATFFSCDYRPTWLVKRMFVRGQPIVIGAPRKTMKTSLMCDLAVSLASGTPFLGNFDCYQAVRVGFLSGESGEWTIQETADRVCFAKGIDPKTLNIRWGFRLPALNSNSDLAELGRGLKTDGVEVVMIDPLFLALISGASGDTVRRVEAGNLYDIGPLLYRVSQTCLDAGATPALVHHFVKSASKTYEPANLEDLSQSGIQEFARQWLLISRRARYEEGSGIHNLWLSVGGSCGQSGLWAVDIDEGQLQDDFSGRRWVVTVQTGADERRTQSQIVEDQKRQNEREKQLADEARVLDAIDKTARKQIAQFTTARAESGLSGPRFEAAVNRLIKKEVIDQSSVRCVIGNGAKRAVKALKKRTSVSETTSVDGCSDG